MEDQVPTTQPKENPARKTLAAKLAEACDTVGGIAKKGRNTAQGYDYVKAADVAKAIRHELFTRGVVILPNEVECTTKQIQFQNAKGEMRNSNEVVIRTAYTITDGAETLIVHGYGVAWDSGDKAVYKAKTGSLKYFLRGLGLIPDEKDDPEADEGIDRATRGGKANETEADYDQRTQGQQTILPFQQKAIQDAMVANGKTEDDLRTYLELIGHKGEKIDRVLKSEFDGLIKWALGKSGKAVATAVLKKPEAKSFEHAWKKVWGTAQRKNVPEEDVKRYYKETFGVEHGAQLTPLQFDELTKWLDGV
jgi:hypothetical protein